jgi:anti-anti-sigma regulatory factor
MEAFASSPRVSIQVAGVSEVDVTTVQLLWAAVSYAKSTGTDLVLEGPVSDAVIKSLAGTGILPLMSTLELRSEKEEDSVLSGRC